MFINELTAEECRRILTEKRVGRIACARENQPYIVPFHFVFDGGDYIYSFATFGQKIEWMRANPLVCVEVDDIKDQFDWTSFIIFGRFEELSELPEFEENRLRAYQFLSRHPMWWQPAYVAGTHQSSEITDYKPIYFRIFVEKITGHHAESGETTTSN
jgi:uncharacterized protein